MEKKKDKSTKQQLLNRIKSLESQIHCNLYAAYRELDGLTASKYMASGVIVTITNLSGVSICTPFMCADGLEGATIDSLKSQIKKTLDLHSITKPKELMN